MTNKCSNCGFEYGEFDIYCARCGHKIEKEADFQTTAQQIYDKFINDSDIENINMQRNSEFFNRKKEYRGNIFDAFAVMFIISLILTVFVLLLSNKQTKTRAYLHYKNLISRPSQIPLLKNTTSVEEFSKELKDNENFLKLYLTYSKDDSEKKEVIFTNYLNELQKLEYITNETLTSEVHPECAKIKDNTMLNKCFSYYNKQLKNTGAKIYKQDNKLFLYPNKKFIKNKYSKLTSSDMKDFLNLEAKYSTPSSFDGILYIKPTNLTKKISKYEIFYNSATNRKIKNIIEEILFNDTKNIIFARNTYTTTTQEMQPAFKKAFNGFILKNKYSPLSALFLSYLDKQKTYEEENFKKDYPYKIFVDTFSENVENTTFKDIFSQLRKNIAANSENTNFAYVYNLVDGKWTKYKAGYEPNEHNYIISFPDEDNNTTIYNFAYTPVQELNIQDNTILFINSGQIYIYNYDKLAISKITFNGKTFNTKNLNFSDVTSIFPGISVINIDSTNNYDIYVEKANKNANFILLSRYAQGLKDYELTALRGEFKKMTLSNMFSVNSNEEIVISFKDKSLNSEETSEQNPSYKIHITTIGQPRAPKEDIKSEFLNEQPVDNGEENDIEPHTPTIKPKINTDESDALILPPVKNLEPPAADEE